jgi:ring-1,2-phenylacetyl-CoA epoxidase subunit PaaA
MASTQVDQDRLAAFEERIARGEKIEPGDWMPEAYRQQLGWITRAPNLRRKLVLLAKVQDEAGHGQYLYHAAETLGVERQDLIEALLAEKAKYSNIFNYPTLSWADIGIIGYFVDGAAILNQTMLARCSYGPYSRANLRICAEESFHMKQGKEMVIRMARGTPEQKRMVQDAVNRWWWPTLMMFGPHDSNSPNSPQLIHWGIKTRTNDDLRQTFVDNLIPELHALDLSVPDPDLSFDQETGHWQFGEIDWDEFRRVIHGDGPCNKERLGARRLAHEEGHWVREALAAYSARQASVEAG